MQILRRSVSYFVSLKCAWTAMGTMALLVAGCAAPLLPQYPSQPLSTYSDVVEVDGLRVAAHPVTNKETLLRYFGDDLVGRGILPVFLVAENRSERESFLIEKERCSIKSGITFSSNDELPSPNSYALLGALPLGLFWGSHLASQAANTKFALATSELRTTTISPGSGTHGFLYFRLPARRIDSRSDEWTLAIRAVVLGTDRVADLEMPVHVGKEVNREP